MNKWGLPLSGSKVPPRVFFVLLALGAVLAMAGAGHAACFYNHSRLPLAIWGQDVNWTISPSDHRCIDGTGGTFLFVLLTREGECCSSSRGQLSVDDNGLLSLYEKEGDSWRAASKRKDGRVKSQTHLQPYYGKPAPR